MNSSPWNKIEPPKETNFQDIMSEQLAQDLQLKENLKAITTTIEENKETEYEIPKEILEQLQKDEHYDSDATIAKMLQNQFDKEHDEMLKREEKKYNRSSKVQISFSKYRTVPDNLLYDDSDQEEAEDPEDKKDWDRFETVEKEFNAIPRCGYKVKEGNLITKHDMTMSGRRNAGKVMSFPPEFQTGDGAGFDMRLSNKVFNSLKVYSRLEQSRSKKLHDKREDHATAEMGVDEPTRLLLYKLINNEILERINGVISTGKEAVVLHAENGTSSELPFKECAVKVFKTTLNEFKTRDKYIKDDFRFKDRFSKQNPRKIIHLWAEKEMHNLMRIKNVGILCPEVVCLKKHILVMSFIGENSRAAPKLKDTILSFEDLCDAYEQILEIVTKLYSEAKLIHADFSEYNVLWHDGKCWLIDVSQAVEHSHPTAYEFLLRDCSNISTFFTKKGIPDVKSAEDLFTLITGLDSRTAIETLNKNKKDKPHLVDRPDHQESYNFDYIWEKCKEQKNECLETSNLNKDKCLNVEPVTVVE